MAFYIFNGPSSSGGTRPSIFPGSGPFTFETALAFRELKESGVGLCVRYAADASPSGSVTVPPGGGEVFRVWGDKPVGGSEQIVITGPWTPVTITTDVTKFRVYQLVCSINGASYKYELYIDGTKITEGNSSFYANTVWMGNPLYEWWSGGAGNWTRMKVDYVQSFMPS